MSDGWVVYLAVGFILSWLFEPEDGRTVGWIVAMTTMWPLTMIVALGRVRL